MGKYQNLENIRVTDGTRQKLSVNDSIDRIIKETEFTLEELSEGEYNGMDIKNPEKNLPDYIEEAIKPVLNLCQAITNTAKKKTGGWESLSIAFDDRAEIGGDTEIDLNDTASRLQNTIEQWLAFVDTQPDNIKQKIGKPLAINAEARLTGKLYSITDVLTLPTNEEAQWVPKHMLNDLDAKEKLDLYTQQQAASRPSEELA